MPAAYSEDLRDRVSAMVVDGRAARAAAGLVRISPSPAVKGVQRWRRTGTSAPGSMGERPGGSLLEAHRDGLNALMEAQPDTTLAAAQALLAEARGQATRLNALSRCCRREGWRFQKSLRAAEQDQPAIAAQRRYWRGSQRFIDADSLVFSDETGLNTKMTRLQVMDW